MKIVLQHLTKKFPARGPVRGREKREDFLTATKKSARISLPSTIFPLKFRTAG